MIHSFSHLTYSAADLTIFQNFAVDLPEISSPGVVIPKWMKMKNKSRYPLSPNINIKHKVDIK